MSTTKTKPIITITKRIPQEDGIPCGVCEEVHVVHEITHRTPDFDGEWTISHEPNCDPGAPIADVELIQSGNEGGIHWVNIPASLFPYLREAMNKAEEISEVINEGASND